MRDYRYDRAQSIAGFYTALASIWVAISYFISFYLYALVLKHIPMGIAYAIWGGLGGAGVVLIGVLVWHDKISPLQITGIVLIILGTFALNAFTPTSP